MIVYRVTHHKYKESTLTGIGAEKTGGRWNEVGTRAVYCSENIALALLEYYVHSENRGFLPKKILVARISFPDDFMIRELSKLPVDWNQYPYSSNTAEVFSQLVKEKNFFALKVPSTIVPMEHNIILNPLYKKFAKVQVLEYLELPIDERLI